jgi:hypothetical protein
MFIESFRLETDFTIDIGELTLPRIGLFTMGDHISENCVMLAIGQLPQKSSNPCNHPSPMSTFAVCSFASAEMSECFAIN